LTHSDWIHEGLIRPGRAFDLGCGAARNAIFLARTGFSVEGVDDSSTAIEWAKRSALLKPGI
jgi:2-polyprenyl-3-methyl-5-hydroxy-6-metoxy-1,4-benzoquinol methylase